MRPAPCLNSAELRGAAQGIDHPSPGAGLQGRPLAGQPLACARRCALCAGLRGSDEILAAGDPFTLLNDWDHSMEESLILEDLWQIPPGE